MREIKFRARMTKPTYGHDTMWVWKGIFGDIWESPNGRYYGEIELKTIGQYTGLKDKNGVEIYEGDIFPWGDKMLVVAYYCGSFVGNWRGISLFIFSQDFPRIQDVEDSLELIGNIYENPELLEEVKNASE